jgi:nitrite reductase/ring-hydroxylating ferredoxin subunit
MARAFLQRRPDSLGRQSIFATKPIKIGGDSMGNPTTWSAPLHDIRPEHSAKFHILWRERLVEAVVVNLGGRYYAYVNYCIHAGTPLDWWPNEFLNDDRRFLTCGTYGSLYEPDTGKCRMSPVKSKASVSKPFSPRMVSLQTRSISPERADLAVVSLSGSLHRCARRTPIIFYDRLF